MYAGLDFRCSSIKKRAGHWLGLLNFKSYLAFVAVANPGPIFLKFSWSRMGFMAIKVPHGPGILHSCNFNSDSEYLYLREISLFISREILLSVQYIESYFL